MRGVWGIAVAVAGMAVWSPMRSGTTESVIGIWGASPEDVFAVGAKGTVLHYDGQAWEPMAVDRAPHLVAVWGATAA